MTLKVLTVDDSKTIRRIVLKAFKKYDCDIAEAENGVEGLTLANKEHPDLIILDITMPIMTGIEMLKKLKEEPMLKNIPVIMLTAESGKDSVMEIVNMGVKDYMVKPFKPNELIERVEKLVLLEEKSEDPSAAASDNLFSQVEGIYCLDVPAKVNRPIAADLESAVRAKLNESVKAGQKKFIMSLAAITDVNMTLIKLAIFIVEACTKTGVDIRIVGNPAIQGELQNFSEIGSVPILDSPAAAAASF